MQPQSQLLLTVMKCKMNCKIVFLSTSSCWGQRVEDVMLKIIEKQFQNCLPSDCFICVSKDLGKIEINK